MGFKNIILEREEDIAVITINRPKVLNALNRETVDELQAAFEEIEQDTAIRAFIITGSGEKAFVAGADINEFTGLTPEEGRLLMQHGQSVYSYLENMGTPSIAAVNGYALGGGCEIAMACDLRIASANAKFGQPETKLGIIPGWGGTQRLTRLVGKTHAKELIYTSRFIGAEEAAVIGLVNKVVPQEELLKTAKDLAHQIAAMPPIAIRMAKLAIDKGSQVDMDTGLNIEAQACALCFATEDKIEGCKAFFEKRPAKFQGK